MNFLVEQFFLIYSSELALNLFSLVAIYFSKNTRNLFLFLLFFHFIVSATLYYIAHTDFLAVFHTVSTPDLNEGFWNFSKDSTKYHLEALSIVSFINNGLWYEFLYEFPSHHHVKLIGFIYWITGLNLPITFEIVNSIIWAVSVLLIYRSSLLLFPGSIKSSLITSLFFFQPTLLLSSTQLLRDPFFIFGFCLIIYGLIIFAKQNSKWKSILIIQIGCLFVYGGIKLNPHLLNLQ